jgi:putative membrane protein
MAFLDVVGDGPMKRAGWFGETSKAAMKKTVEALESRSSVEVVVAVHPASASYRHAEWITGSLFALVWLAVFLYSPEPFDFTFLPLELLGAGAAGALLAWAVGPWKRALTRRRTMSREVERSAKAAFFDLGVSRTRGRTGVLVFLSVFERRAILVRDAGVPKLAEFGPAERELAGALEKSDLERATKILEGLGDALARALPRAAGDVNELADDVVEAA